MFFFCWPLHEIALSSKIRATDFTKTMTAAWDVRSEIIYD